MFNPFPLPIGTKTPLASEGGGEHREVIVPEAPKARTVTISPMFFNLSSMRTNSSVVYKNYL
jgi:hypothetical protein